MVNTEHLIDTEDKLSERQKILIEVSKTITDPFSNLTVADVAKDLKMGENLTNQLFKRDDFPSVNIGKTKTVTKLAYLLWKMERKV